MVLVCALLFASTAHADRVVLKNGRVLEGSARTTASGEIEISSTMGTLRIPAHLVDRVEDGATLEQQIELLARRPGQTAESLLALSLEAESAGAATLARRLLLRVIDLDPDHDRARDRLGHLRHDGRWVSEAEWRRLRGEVRFRGEWMPLAERARILSLEAMTRQVAQQRLLESERIARWTPDPSASGAAPTLPASGGGIPLGYLWTPTSPPVVPPAFVPLPRATAPEPAPGRVTPPGVAPPPPPRPPPKAAGRPR